MADMTAFERQLAARLELIAGPEPHVDAMASARTAMSIASTRRPFTMLSALKFVVTGVIVALFGGFLLAGIVPMPDGHEALPAAVTASPTAEGTPSGGGLTVSIDGLEGAYGSRLAAILYEGVPILAGGDTPLHGLGAFTADITSDPFSVTGPVVSVTDPFREGFRWLEAAPDAAAADVPAGVHTLVVWVSHDLVPYSDWVPGEPIDRVCARFLTVAGGDQATVHVGPQPFDWQTLEAPPIPICLPEISVAPEATAPSE